MAKQAKPKKKIMVIEKPEDIAEEMIVEDPEPIERLAERFVCNRYPSYSIGLENRMIQFKAGEYVTDDPDEIKAIMDDPYYGVFIMADNPELRKSKR